LQLKIEGEKEDEIFFTFAEDRTCFFTGSYFCFSSSGVLFLFLEGDLLDFNADCFAFFVSKLEYLV
jgi:hypothetical protein